MSRREVRSGRGKRQARRWVLSVLTSILLLGAALPCRAGEERAVKSKVAPVYPEIARRMRIAGVVKVEATVDAAGQVKSVKTISGNRVLAEAAEEAVRKWKFAPGPGEAVVPVDVAFAAVAP